MGVKIKCFFLEETGKTRLTLRRYSSGNCPATGGSYHNAEAPLFDANERFEFDDRLNWSVYHHDGPQSREEVSEQYADRWPAQCACGYAFTDSDPFQIFSRHLYRRTDTGEILTAKEAPAGAMCWAPWADAYFRPQLSHALVVILPGGREWMPDSRASNCTRRDDDRHHCWVMRGLVPDVTVDKNGDTCSAGAGSISVPGWHGFLRNGYLEEC